MSLEKINLSNRNPDTIKSALKKVLDHYRNIDQAVKCTVMNTKNNTCCVYVYPRDAKPRKAYKKRSYGGSRGKYKPRTLPTKPYKPRTSPTPRRKYGNYTYKPIKKMDWEQLAEITNLLNTELGITTDITPEQVEQIMRTKLAQLVNTNKPKDNIPLC
jgi:hypothetical protein